MISTDLLLSFYGDDFTGSTDSMEALTLHGIRTALFLEPPTLELLRERFSDLRAVGVAGMSRSWSPAQMEAQLRPIFEAIKRLGAPLFHYKTCSTFDSSPTVGSIGRAIDIGQELFPPLPVPLVVGAPALRRYTLFGNLFATVGDETFRLDRHPTMRHHPVTPMDEGDLRLHLGKQTSKSVVSFDILHLSGTDKIVDQRYEALLATQPEVVLFDVLDEQRLATAGRLMWEHRGDQSRLVVGSSGIEYALVGHWRASGALPAPQLPARPQAVEQLVVVSGSCSPETQRQIAWAVEHGFATIALDTVRLMQPDEAERACAGVIRESETALAHGQSVIIYTSSGPHDPQIAATAAYMRDNNLPLDSVGERIGTQLGAILRTLVKRSGLRRVVVAGGDTSGHVVRQLGIVALEVVAPLAPGSPLCRTYAHDPAFDGLEIALKGGQVGKADFFERVRRGGNE